MSPEEAYEEALRRIRDAEKTGVLELDLSELKNSNRLPPELAGLTSLKLLDLVGCWWICSDLSPLAGLTSLQSLSLSGGDQLSGDLSPLAGLTSLQSLSLSGVDQLSGDLSPLASLTSLRSLSLTGCSQLSGDLSPLAGLTSLQSIDLSYKQLSDLSPLSRLTSLKSLNLRGCDVLSDLSPLASLASLQSLDLHDGCPQLNDLSPLTSLASLQSLYLDRCVRIRFAPVECLLPTLKRLSLFECKLDDLPPEVCGEWRENVLNKVRAHYDDLKRWLEASARTGLGLNLLKGALEESERDRFERRPPPPIGVGRVAVRDQLRHMLKEDQERESARRQHRLLERAEFDRICDEVGAVSDKNALLDFLHQNGILFYRPELFGDRIVLDQNWALEAIYSIFHRDKCFKQLKKLHGRFSREDLELLIWSDYTPEEQRQSYIAVFCLACRSTA